MSMSVISETFVSGSSEDGEISMEHQRPSHDTSPQHTVLGRWPRRLLHVDIERDILTSCEWQPGNFYGGRKEPKYNVLSYTWGRFQIPSGKRLDVKGVDIRGVPWAIPRVDPDVHFSAANFRAAIKNACTNHEVEDEEAVQFLWLDIACIDQENDVVKLFEVGRQAVIFQHAESAFVWLSRTCFEDLERLQRELWSAANGAPPPNLAFDAQHANRMEEWLDTWLETCVKQTKYILEKEPWFTSLWTLQEAYLRNFACLLARDGRAAPEARAGFGSGPARLRELAFAISRIQSICYRSLSLGCSRQGRVRYLSRRIGATGLAEVCQDNPFVLLKAASSREFFQELDRVYAIMQVFGFKLGASNPKTPANLSMNNHRPFRRRLNLTLSDLELELSEQILAHYPVQSHLSIFTSVPDTGHAWRLSPAFELPYFATLASSFLFVNRGPQSTPRSDEHKQVSLCQFKVTTDMSLGRQQLSALQRYISEARNFRRSPITWCHFRGKACPFTTLSGIWKRLNQRGTGRNARTHTIKGNCA